MAKVSVILVVKDEPAIDQTLSKLSTQITIEEVECIVVDASEGRLSDISLKHSSVIWLDFHPRNSKKTITIAEQRNVGVRSSHGEIIVFCDAGSSPEPGWFDAITAPLLAGQQDLVGGPIRATNPSSPNVWTNLQDNGDEIHYPTTANLALTREAFELVDGFNEDLDYGSDADLVWRLNAEGIKQICVANAVMGLDGGSKRREHKRAWRYGKALADLLRLHPNRRVSKVKSNPEIWIYPTLMTVVLCALLPIGFSKILGTTFILANLALVLKNVRARNPLQILINHYIYGWGFCYELLRKSLPRTKLAKVLIYPGDDIRYLEELHKGIKLLKPTVASVAPFPKLTPSNTLNILLLPLITPLLRLRGTRIIHIHWLYRFNLVWSKGKLSGFLIEKWFKLWIRSMRWVGIKVVWTAHNILPHDPIFRDDYSIRKYLVQSCARVIALSTESQKEVLSTLSATEVVIVPEGPLFHPTTFSKTEFRSRLNVPEGNLLLISLGSLAPYKGISDLLIASQSLNRKISIRIAGWCDAAEQRELERLCQEASLSGSDIEIMFGKLTKNEFGGYLRAADFYLAPFRRITNSGSLNAALTAGLPVVIPNLPSLQSVPRDAAICYQPGEDGRALAATLESLNSISQDELITMKTTAGTYTSQNPWASVAEKHLSLYTQILHEK